MRFAALAAVGRMVLIRMRAALLMSVFGMSLVVNVPPVLAQPVQATAPRPASRPAAPVPQPGGTIASIRVVGNERIETGTVSSYLVVQPGDAFDPDKLDRSLKSLYATGLFSDVTITRDGSTLVVRVAENPVINRIAFEGNKKLTDANLRAAITLKPRAVFTPALAQAERQRILDAYAKKGRFGARVEPKVIQLDQNRVDLVFEIDEGVNTYISRIAFVGVHEFSENKLREVVSSREEAWWRFLSSTDSYDPERLVYDRELLRRFYIRNGYVDIDISQPTAELAPDRSAFFVSYTVNEGERYRLGKVDIKSNLRNLDPADLQSTVDVTEGDWYDGTEIETINESLGDAVRARGYAFVDVRPDVRPNKQTHTVDVTFNVGEGPRVYVERIDIVGNVRTKDKVIRREFRLAEGDAFNSQLLRRSRQRLDDLGYFNTATVTSAPGSQSDKAVVTTTVDEKATGELTIGGGYSSDAGALLNLGLREKNLIGTGVDAGINGVLAQKQTQLDLSLTDPYFLDRNLIGAIDLFAIQSNLQNIAQYNERRAGASFSLGYEVNEHLRQNWTYSLVQRNIYNVQDGASIYVQDEAGTSLLSQVGQVLALDYRDSRVDPKSGFIVRLGTDYAGLGGDTRFVRSKVDSTYYIPLERTLGDPDYMIALSAGAGYMVPLGQHERIIDRFFLGGDNLRGFQTGGAGPHAVSGGDSIGGRLIWTQSSEFRFPLPVSPDLGLTGRLFVDIGGLTEASSITRKGNYIQITSDNAPRLGAGFGVSWKTPFGLINLDFAPIIIKKSYDQSQFFRFGFGTRF